MNFKKIISTLLALCLIANAEAVFASESMSELKNLPIQDAGRLKPFDTFARETLQLIYGRAEFADTSAAETVMLWLLFPEEWNKKEIVKIDRRAIKKALQVEEDKKFFTPEELFANTRLPLLIQDLKNKRQAQEKLDPYFQDVQKLESQLSIFRAITMGMALRFLPPKQGDTWLSVHEFDAETQNHFKAVVDGFISYFQNKIGSGEDNLALKSAVQKFKEHAKSQNPELYPSDKLIQTETHYNELHPFRWAWVIELLALILLSFAWYRSSSKLKGAAWVVFTLGFLLHTYGFWLRMYITGRPPVSNMYESVIWVSWGAAVFGMIFEAIYKKYFILFSAIVVNILCLIVSDLAPNVLDPSLQPLEAVLRSNMWLVVHVLVITLSYSAFFLALVLGNIGIYYYLKDKDQKRGEDLAKATYRVIQVGVVLLFAGTVLGGIWADYSWGRFWGWDPKETWAFIAFMGYMILLHARKAGYVRSFGLLAGSVVAFSLVLMAWYGVNFVLGAGLHSYGFGGGGVPYVAAFIAVHFLYVAYALTVWQNRNKLR